MAPLSLILAATGSAAALLLAPTTAQAATPAARGNASETATATELVTLTVPARIPADYLVGGDVTVGVSPASYSGRIIVLDRDGAQLGSAVATKGKARVEVAADQLGAIPVKVTAAAATGFDTRASTAQATVVSRGVPLVRGSRSPAVVELLRGMRRQNYLIPGLTKRYTNPVSDVVLAFQKVNDLPRTAEMNARTWRAFSQAEPVTPKRRGSGTHIEVDKTRQVLMLVRNGSVLGTLHVSTGATGNTPEGRFRIYAKGVGHLFRFMPFIGNFGIHGYIPVPPYPASHGCVREPMWAANWTYEHSRIGTPVIIYH